MKVNELVEKLQNGNPTTQDYEMVLQWCTENVDTMDLSDKNVSYLFDIAMRYLMNEKLLHWDKTDARLIINYLARNFVHKNKISDKVTIEILEEGQNADVYSVADFLVKQRNISREEAIKFLQEEGYFEIANNPAAHCSSDTKDSTSHIYYTSVITDYILSKEPDKIVYGLGAIIHEVTHAVQHYNLVKELENYFGNNYILAMEVLMQNADRIFQGINYSNLFSENQANCIGLQNARDFIKQYNHEFYEQCEPQKVEDRILTYISWMYPKNPISEFKGEKVNTFDLASQVAMQTIQKTPEILEQMPVLKKAYNSDGSQKSVEQLLEEREQGIASKKDIELLNSLYEEIFTYRISNSREDLTSLINYIERTGTEDKFIYGVVQSRMENLQYTPEEVKSRVAVLHEISIGAKSNSERTMQEPKQ